MNRLLLPCAALLSMAAVGCGSASAPQPSPVPAQPASSVRTIQRATTTPAPPAPMRTVKSDEAALQLLSVQRTGPAVVTAQLRLVVPEGGQIYVRHLSDGDNDYSVSGARMVDEVHGRQYLPLHDDAGECLCTHDMDAILSDDATDVSVKFPAPDGDVNQVSVQLPGFPSFDQLPI